jgi:hypothetical protein
MVCGENLLVLLDCLHNSFVFGKFAQIPYLSMLFPRSSKQTASVCLECIKKMPSRPDGALAEGYITYWTRFEQTTI